MPTSFGSQKLAERGRSISVGLFGSLAEVRFVSAWQQLFFLGRETAKLEMRKFLTHKHVPNYVSDQLLARLPKPA